MPSRPASPTVRLRRLHATLRELRKATGRSARDVATALDWAESKLTRLETISQVPKLHLVAALLDELGVTGDERAQVLALAEEARQTGWWQRYDEVLGKVYRTYIGLEAEAVVVRTFEDKWVPGILQTEEYARAAIAGIAPHLSADQVEQRAQVRMQRQRQRLIDDTQPPRLWAILDESVLRRMVGGPRVMREQLDHLLAAASLPQVTLQVVPFNAGAHPGIGPFVHLTFEEPLDPEAVYTDTINDQTIVETEADVARFRKLFDALIGIALSHDTTVDMLTKIAKSIPERD